METILQDKDFQGTISNLAIHVLRGSTDASNTEFEKMLTLLRPHLKPAHSPADLKVLIEECEKRMKRLSNAIVASKNYLEVRDSYVKERNLLSVTIESLQQQLDSLLIAEVDRINNK